MKILQWLNNASNGIQIYSVDKIDDLHVNIKGLLKGAEIGDVVHTHGSVSRVFNSQFKIVEIIQVRDAKGVFENEEDSVSTYVECICEPYTDETP